MRASCEGLALRTLRVSLRLTFCDHPLNPQLHVAELHDLSHEVILVPTGPPGRTGPGQEIKCGLEEGHFVLLPSRQAHPQARFRRRTIELASPPGEYSREHRRVYRIELLKRIARRFDSGYKHGPLPSGVKQADAPSLLPRQVLTSPRGCQSGGQAPRTWWCSCPDHSLI